MKHFQHIQDKNNLVLSCFHFTNEETERISDLPLVTGMLAELTLKHMALDPMFLLPEHPFLRRK